MAGFRPEATDLRLERTDLRSELSCGGHERENLAENKIIGVFHLISKQLGTELERINHCWGFGLDGWTIEGET